LREQEVQLGRVPLYPCLAMPLAPTRRTCALGVILGFLTASEVAQASDPSRVEWSEDWPRVRLWEVATIVALTVASFEINSQWKTPRGADWRGGILFDDAVRSALRGRTTSVQLTASDLGDALYVASVYTPYVIDNYFAALSIHQNVDVALQMTLIDMQSLGIAGVVTLAAERTIPRRRPFAGDCGPDGKVRDASGQVSESCGQGDDFKSFYSGHAAATATMAGLTCVHHQHLPLYGGGFADLVPCLVMIGVSATTGVTRIVADRHWASDVILGWGIGAFSGYVLPSLLHYGFGRGRAVGEVTFSQVSMVPVFQAYPAGGGAGIAGLF
jgi:membrane-associated phospholipid phosphatase